MNKVYKVTLRLPADFAYILEAESQEEALDMAASLFEDVSIVDDILSSVIFSAAEEGK